ncbi:hypothetical protein SAMN05660662_1569 [Blastococcus aurantiacus]|uniref:Uncharacterized protein n=1 Tax=Blastococcus aurantiacus TaxID=1550231 RepID=A0A1G7JM13_9ACTN|nr:hypothetical protein [Blastococcus aurantiacus]SDF25499.1 hypothetical protein SAMN05660662_1569 [Blastococcus aurantiacus]
MTMQIPGPRTPVAARSVSDDALRRVAAHREQYDRLVEVVEAYARQGDLERVLLTATLIGNMTWCAPVGLLADPRLERAVVSAARAGGPAPEIDGQRARGRVLHVLSETYGVGGHTRLAWRWIERDPRRSDVVLTNQGGPSPEPLRAAARSTGGQVFDLKEAHPTFGARAHALRRHMDAADVVVLHTHPWDAIALAAANMPGRRPPVLLENHADHTFWLGLGCADLVVDNRSPGLRVTRELRGVRPERHARLALPVPDVPLSSSREEMRAALGLQDQVAALSVGSPYKMSPVWGEGFDGILAQALERFDQLVVYLVGPSDTEQWQALGERFPGRVFPLGFLPDPESLFPAMDLYLDSYPLTGGTALVEAAMAGLPTLSLQPDIPYGDVYHADIPGVTGAGYVGRTDDEYFATLAELVADPDLRHRRGRHAAEQVRAVNAGPAWDAGLEAVYDLARSAAPADLDEYPERIEEPGYGARLSALTARIMPAGTIPAPEFFAEPIAGLLDRRMRYDLAVVAAHRPTLAVRVPAGWECHEAWMARLAETAAAHPRLRVSLPPVPGDDATAAASIACLTSVLESVGQTTEDCGDLCLEVEAPEVAGLSIGEELTFSADALDVVDELLGSALWTTDRALVTG